MNPAQAWQAALGELQLQMTRATFDTWVKETSVFSYEDGLFVLAVRSNFAKEWLENRLMGLIKRTLGNIMGRSIDVRFAVQPKEHQLDQPDAGPLLNVAVNLDETDTRGSRAHIAGGANLNEKYTFASFIVGSSNRLAHAAARSVAERPAAAYNPLFLYGGVGLGKTHLLQAIGHYCLQRGGAVRYVSSEQFTNELINSIRSQATGHFREKYRSIDVLLIDDIQFIAGKESTQEEFFHTFNTLHAANKQIVVSSDRPPRAIHPLEERLRSRFEGGLMADISPPDLETRVAILRTKAESDHSSISEAVLDFIARKVQSNIRELVGSLNRVIIYGSTMHQPVSVELAAEALRDTIGRPQHMEPAEIIEVAASHYRISMEDILGERRNKEIALSRQMAMYLLRIELHLSYSHIGALLGNRDHTTVMHAYEKIKKLIEENADIRRDYLVIRDTLYHAEKVDP
jgi:chromosomal replication initiator protein